MQTEYNIQDAQTVFDAVCADLFDDPCWQEELNLKLPDVSYYCDKIIDKYTAENDLIFISNISRIFNDFCEDMYAEFKAFLKDEGIDDSIMHYIGRTSGFRLTNLYDVKKYQYRQILSELMPDVWTIDATLDGKLYCCEWEDVNFGVPNDDYFLDIKDIVLHMQENLNEYIQDARKVYVYIVDFKRDELDYFKEWLNDNEWRYFEPKSIPFEEFPLDEIENCIENIEKSREYTCNTSQDMIIYNKLTQIKSVLKGA